MLSVLAIGRPFLPQAGARSVHRRLDRILASDQQIYAERTSLAGANYRLVGIKLNSHAAATLQLATLAAPLPSPPVRWLAHDLDAVSRPHELRAHGQLDKKSRP